MTVRLCITGGVACGKSAVAGFFAEFGAAVLDADKVCHALMRKGSKPHADIVGTFGAGILAPDGEIDRRLLGEAVFGEPEKLAALNALTHPAVISEMDAWLEKTAPRSGCSRVPVAAGVVPLVFETGWIAPWDKILCVSAPAGAQMERLAGRGFFGARAAARIEAQMPLEEKEAGSDYVIFNGGGMESLRRQSKMVFEAIIQEEVNRHG